MEEKFQNLFDHSSHLVYLRKIDVRGETMAYSCNITVIASQTLEVDTFVSFCYLIEISTQPFRATKKSIPLTN